MTESIETVEKIQSNISLNIWKYENHPFQTISSPLQNILNTNHINDFDTIEKYIYDTSIFHMKNKSIEFNPDQHTIEFSSLTTLNSFKLDYHKKTKKYPLFSIVLFLDETYSPNPMIFTDIDMESYKYKEIKDENTFVCIKPGKNTQLVFDSSKYYGIYKMNENSTQTQILKINIWDTKINEIPVYVSDKNKNENISINITPLTNATNYEHIVYKNMIHLFLYEEIPKLFVLENILSKYPEDSQIIINNTNKNYNDINTLLETYGEIAHDIYPFVNNTIDVPIDFENNRFYKNKIIQKIISKDVCYWIINECEKFEWETSKYQNYNTYLNIEKMPSIMSFLLFISNFWLMEIKKSYKCENVKFNINDMFVSKFTKEKINEKQNMDNSFLIMNIYLNDDVDYKDGEIIFENTNEKIQIHHGDCLLYNGKKNRTIGSVSDGVKYVLVLIIDIML